MIASSILLAFALSAGAQTAVQPAPQAPAGTPQKELRAPDVMFVPTPQEVLEAMLNVAKAGKGDVLYDLGSGDGRIPITAAQKYGIARGIGVDIDPQRIKEANENLAKAGVGDRVTFMNADLFETNLSEATVVTLYRLPTLNLKLLPKLLKELKKVDGRSVYFWTIPAPGTPSYKAAMAAANGA